MRSKWKLSEVYFFFVPESFRFLIAKGRIDDAKRCFKRFPLKRSKTEITNNPDSKNQNGNNYTDEIKETDLFIENGNKPLSSLPNYLTNAEQNPFAQVEQQNFLESVASMVSNQTLQDDYSNDQERFLKIIIKFTYQKHVSCSHWSSMSHTIWLPYTYFKCYRKLQSSIGLHLIIWRNMMLNPSCIMTELWEATFQNQ